MVPRLVKLGAALAAISLAVGFLFASAPSLPLDSASVITAPSPTNVSTPSPNLERTPQTPDVVFQSRDAASIQIGCRRIPNSDVAAKASTSATVSEFQCNTKVERDTLPFTKVRCVAGHRSSNTMAQNISCLWENLYYLEGKFVAIGLQEKDLPPTVSLGSIPKIKERFFRVTQTLQKPSDMVPSIESLYAIDSLTAYFSSLQAWNFAHTLFGDLFPVYWMLDVFGLVREVLDQQKSLTLLVNDANLGLHFLPNNNTAWKMFSSFDPVYVASLFSGMMRAKPGNRYYKAGSAILVRRLLVGTGMKGWSHFLPTYRAPGSPTLWWRFREFLHHRGKWKQNVRSTFLGGNGTIRVFVCNKKDKRAIVNPKDVIRWVSNHTLVAQPIEVQFVDLSQYNAEEQLRWMAETHLFICNEGTMSTYFFLMNQGSSNIPIAQYYAPDMRPDPRKRVGGAVDWLPPTIDWVRTEYYENITLQDVVVRKGSNRRHNHNRNVEYDIVVREERFMPILLRSLRFVRQAQESRSVGLRTLSDSDGYTATGRICSQFFPTHLRSLEMVLNVYCKIDFSFLCEMLVNVPASQRKFHYKMRRSDPSACWKEALGIADPREERPLTLPYLDESMAQIDALSK